MTRELLVLAYQRPLIAEHVAAARASCPEIGWLAKCALGAPLPPGWQKLTRPITASGVPCSYSSETGELSAVPPCLGALGSLARLTLQARQEPGKSAYAGIRKVRDDAMAQALQAQDLWTGPHVDPKTGAEFFHCPTSGTSTWVSPVAFDAYVAHIANKLLGSKAFYGQRAAEPSRPPCLTSLTPPCASARVEGSPRCSGRLGLPPREASPTGSARIQGSPRCAGPSPGHYTISTPAALRERPAAADSGVFDLFGDGLGPQSPAVETFAISTPPRSPEQVSAAAAIAGAAAAVAVAAASLAGCEQSRAQGSVLTALADAAEKLRAATTRGERAAQGDGDDEPSWLCGLPHHDAEEGGSFRVTNLLEAFDLEDSAAPQGGA